MDWHHEGDRIHTANESAQPVAEARIGRTRGGCIDIKRVHVDSPFKRQGLAEMTMLTVVDYFREHRLKVITTCPYARGWFDENRAATPISWLTAPAIRPLRAEATGLARRSGLSDPC